MVVKCRDPTPFWSSSEMPERFPNHLLAIQRGSGKISHALFDRPEEVKKASRSLFDCPEGVKKASRSLFDCPEGVKKISRSLLDCPEAVKKVS